MLLNTNSLSSTTFSETHFLLHSCDPESQLNTISIYSHNELSRGEMWSFMGFLLSV